MEKNIYDLLNQVEVDLSEYEEREMSELRKKRLLNNFISSKTKKGNGYKKYIVVASAAVISFGAIGTLPTLATINPTAYKIATMLGIEKDLEGYTTVIDQPIIQNGITVGLGEVAYDKVNEELIVTTYTTSNNSIQNTDDLTMHGIHARIYINGQRLNTSASGHKKIIDEKTIAYVTSYDVEENIDGGFDITIDIPQVFVDDQEHRGNWKFQFSVDGDQLASDTQVIELDASVQLQKDSELKLVKYTSNVFGKSIYYMFEGEMVRNFEELRGEDNFGNPVVFEYASGMHNQGGEFTLDTERSNLSTDATQITLKLYTSTVVGEDEEMERVYEAVGEEIIIDLTAN
ncbi:MAG: DUF4179 domain-containing protein [Cellulosilyticaceae bacterium]